MKLFPLSALTSGLVLMAACSSNQNIIIDTEGVDMSQYTEDLAYCEQFKGQVEGEVGKETAIGAAVGGATGGIWGGHGEDAARGAGAGAVVGAVNGIRGKKKEEQQVVKNCLRTKGYKVLN